MAARQEPPPPPPPVQITFSACGHTATFEAGAKTTAPARCPRGCDPVAPQHNRWR